MLFFFLSSQPLIVSETCMHVYFTPTGQTFLYDVETKFHKDSPVWARVVRTDPLSFLAVVVKATTPGLLCVIS